MVYILARTGPQDEPRIATIHTPEEVVFPVWSGGTWVAECSTVAAARVLQGRRYGFALVRQVIHPSEYVLPMSTDEIIESMGFVIRNEGPPDTREGAQGPEADWLAWRRRRGPPVAPIDTGDLHKRLRARIDANTLADATTKATHPGWNQERVAIVKVCHGWGEHEQAVVQDALDAAVELGPKSMVCVVQNDTEAHFAFMEWMPERHPNRYLSIATRNDGFGAACNAGARLYPGAGWYLFTQPDARWDARTVRQAASVSRAFTRPPDGFGLPAIVGPSGGFLHSMALGACSEYGRNVESHRGLPMAGVDWIAGYWFLVPGEVYQRVCGWSERYFLYYEDPDLSLRCAMAGARPIVWPALQVDHVRGGTIKARVSPEVVSEIRQESRQTFGLRWGGR